MDRCDFETFFNFFFTFSKLIDDIELGKIFWMNLAQVDKLFEYEKI